MPPCAAKGETMTKHDEPAWMDGTLSAEERLRRAVEEIALLRRKMDHAAPWGVSDPPTDDEMRALRLRWANGPERYQADADALIAAVISGQKEIARLRAYIADDAEKYTVLAAEVARLRSEAMPLVETCEALRALLAAEREKTERSVPMESILAARDLFEMGSAEYDAIDDILAGKWTVTS